MVFGPALAAAGAEAAREKEAAPESFSPLLSISMEPLKYAPSSKLISLMVNQ